MHTGMDDDVQADLSALWQLASAYLEWQTALALKAVPDAMLPPPLQTALTLELGMSCRLQQPLLAVGSFPLSLRKDHLTGYLEPASIHDYCYAVCDAFLAGGIR